MQIPLELDAVDRKVLSHLREEPTASVRALARSVGMSPGAVGERIDRLRASGVIRGVHLELDMSTLGFGLEVLIGVQLNQNRPVVDTIASLQEIPEVVEVYVVTGRWDLVLRLRTRDQEHLRDVLTAAVWDMSDFRHSESMLVLESHRSDRAVVGLLES